MVHRALLPRRVQVQGGFIRLCSWREHEMSSYPIPVFYSRRNWVLEWGNDLPTSRSGQHSSLASHPTGKNYIFPKNKILPSSQKRDFQVWNKSNSRPPLLKLKLSWHLKDIHWDQLLSYHPQKPRWHSTLHCSGRPCSHIYGFFSWFLPHSLWSCWRPLRQCSNHYTQWKALSSGKTDLTS